MSGQEKPSAAEQFRADMHQGAVAVADHIRERSSLLDGVFERPSTMDRDTNLRVLFDRANAWAGTLRKLYESYTKKWIGDECKMMITENL